MTMTENNQRPIRRWPAFVAGAVTAFLISGAIMLTGRVAREWAAFGRPDILTDEGVRRQIQESGVELPKSASKLYYARFGFVDQEEYIAFTAAPEECMKAARDFALRATNAPVFVDGTRSQNDAVTKGLAFHRAEWASPLWDLTSVTNGKMLEMRHLFVLVDTDANRVYISTWNE